MTETRQQWVRIGALGAAAFVVLGSYSVARPATESLFLQVYGPESLPSVWLGVAFAAVLVVSFYNRFVTSVPLVSLFARASIISGVFLTLFLLAFQMGWEPAAYMLYVWKDVYIVVLVEIFWSFANAVFQVGMARWIYGLFCVMGSLGSMAANFSMGPLAKRMGTANSLWLVLPLLALSALICWALGRIDSKSQVRGDDKAPTDFAKGFQVMAGSRYLMIMLGLVGVVQLVITLVDYQFNAMLFDAYPETDLRTGAIGEVYGWIDNGAIILQLVTGVILKVLGVPLTLLVIPVFLGAAVAGFAIAPRYATIAIAKVASKCFDYSIFRAAKEILYIPLSFAEKTQGKAIVDMLAYRVAKGAVSVLLMGLILVGNRAWVNGLALLLILVWIGLTVAIVKRYYRRLAETAETPDSA